MKGERRGWIKEAWYTLLGYLDREKGTYGGEAIIKPIKGEIFLVPRNT